MGVWEYGSMGVCKYGNVVYGNRLSFLFLVQNIISYTLHSGQPLKFLLTT
jgi:hypothetical protein